MEHEQTLFVANKVGQEAIDRIAKDFANSVIKDMDLNPFVATKLSPRYFERNNFLITVIIGTVTIGLVIAGCYGLQLVMRL